MASLKEQSGNVMLLDSSDRVVQTFAPGVGGASPSATYSTTYTISPAAFNALKTTPLALAPGVSGKIIRPMRMLLIANVGTVYDSNWTLKDDRYFGSGYLTLSLATSSTGPFVACAVFGGSTSGGSVQNTDPADVGAPVKLTTANAYTVGALAVPATFQMDYILV